ncbi:hypothetical protein Tco_1569039, partial [Tanacetum coccineum]
EIQGNATNSLYSHIGKHMNLTELNDQQAWFSGDYDRTWIDHDENGLLHNVIEESRSSSTGFLPSLQELRKTFHFYPYISRHASLEIEISFPSVLTNRLWKLNENSRSVVTADGEYAAEQPQGLPAVIAELTRWAAQNLELTLKSEINVGPRLSEEGRLKRRSRKCNTTRGEPKACAKEEANQSEWRQGGEKRKIEQCKGERSCPLFSGNPPPHMSKKRERGRKNNHFTLAHEVAGLASAYSLSINKMRNGGERKRSLLKRLCTRNRTNADPEEWVWAFEKMNMQRVRADGDSRTGKSGTRHLLNKTKNKAIPCPREKLVMIAMNAALEDVYKKVFADSYQHGTDSEKEEAWHEIAGQRISDSELLDSMDGGRALQLKHEINVESTIIQRGTTKRDQDQPLEEFQPLLPLGRVSLLSELAGREDQLINMNLESGWLIAASLYWRLSGRGGACYRNLFPGVNLVRSILREKKDGNEWEDWSSLFISRKELVSTSLIRRTNKKRLTV